MKKVVFRVTVAAVLAGAVWGGYQIFRQLPQRQQQVASTKVRRGDVVIRSFARGELRAVRSVTLSAPNLFSTVQVTKLAPMGSLAHEKDLIAEFDDSDRRANLEEIQLEVEQTDEQIKKSQADIDIRNAQDQVDLLKTRYAVRRAELEVQRNELLSVIDAKKNLLNLEEQRRRLKQLESDIKSRQQQAEAEIAVLREQRNKSTVEVQREWQRIATAKVLSPMTGLVSIRQNRSQGFFYPGMQLPDIREGDTLQPGVPVADILDLSELEVSAKIGELDRANLREGQDVLIELDAIPGRKFAGNIKSMSGTASANIFSGDPAKKFDVAFSISMRELLTALGASPSAIERIMSTAARNRGKAPAPPAPPPPAPAGGAQPSAAPRAAGASANSGTAADLAALLSAPPGQFTDADRERAKLPAAPELDSQLEVLIRPGLLADVEIIVEKIPNAVHIPNQAVFEKEGKFIAWVRSGKQFEQRPITIARRSESTVVVTSGLKPDDTVALADPYAKKADDRSGKKGSANPLGSIPGDSGGRKAGK